MKEFNEILNYRFHFSEAISISVKGILFVLLVILITSVVLKILRRLITRNLPRDDKAKFSTVFAYVKWIVYVVFLLITLNAIGFNVTGVFAASAAYGTLT